ncbi:MAG: hypothetical protein ACRDX8_02195 [Acidimicrobiales bacterium]
MHRQKVVNGVVIGTSNLWRIRIPDHLRAECDAAEDAARSRPSGGGGRGKAKGPRHTPSPYVGVNEGPGTAAAALRARNEAIRSTPCASCGGDRWVQAAPPLSGVITCPACSGLGTARDGP